MYVSNEHFHQISLYMSATISPTANRLFWRIEAGVESDRRYRRQTEDTSLLLLSRLSSCPFALTGETLSLTGETLV
jgi:hypothetical protein